MWRRYQERQADDKFAALLSAYLVLALTYSRWLNAAMSLGVVTLAGLYMIRIFAGAVAVGVTVSAWLLAFSVFLSLCLASLKHSTKGGDAKVPERRL